MSYNYYDRRSNRINLASASWSNQKTEVFKYGYEVVLRVGTSELTEDIWLVSDRRHVVAGDAALKMHTGAILVSVNRLYKERT